MTERSADRGFVLPFRPVSRAAGKPARAVAAACVVLLLWAVPSAPTSAALVHTALPSLRVVGYVSSDGALAASLDPAYASEAADRWVVNTVDQSLVGIDQYGGIINELASKVAVSPDRTRYVFTLRKAFFANGDPVTAGAVAYSIKRALKAPGSVVAYYDESGYAGIKGADAVAVGHAKRFAGVKVLSGNRLEIVIEKPIAAFLRILASGPNNVVDPAVVKRGPTTPVNNLLTTDCRAARDSATGPFTFQCSGRAFFPANQDPHYTLVPNSHYTGPFRPPRVRLVIQNSPSVLEAQAKYVAGQTDAVAAPVAQTSSGRLLRWSGSAVEWLALNVVDPPFNNLHCRLAVAYGLNRSLFVAAEHGYQATREFAGTVRAARRIVPPGILPGYTLKSDPHFGVARSRAEMARCPGRSREVAFPETQPEQTQPLMNTLHAIGFSHVRLWPCTNPGCPPDWVQLHLAVLEAATETWDMDYPDPQDYLPLLFSARSQFNVGGFHDRVFDTLVNRATTDANAADRSRLYRHAERRLLAQAAVIPIWLQWPQWTIRRSVSGLRGAAPTGNFPVPVGGDWSRVHLQ